MKILAFNGSPRKDGNTAAMIKSAVKGAESRGGEVELVHLYDLNYKGCSSCFACKLLGGKSYGRCASRDELTPYLQKVEEADALLIGSPVYLGAASGETRSFFERLLFPFYTYTNPPGTLFKKRIKVGLVYAFGATEEMASERGWDKIMDTTGGFIKLVLGEVRTARAFDCYQFSDYSKYESSRFDPAQKLRRREEVFPQECRKAFELGEWLAA